MAQKDGRKVVAVTTGLALARSLRLETWVAPLPVRDALGVLLRSLFSATAMALKGAKANMETGAKDPLFRPFS